MTPDHITAALAERLRAQGLHVRQADVEAFAEGLPPLADGAVDLEDIVDRFIRASRFFGICLRRRRNAVRILTAGVFVLVAGVVSTVITSLGLAVARLGPSSRPPVDLLAAAMAASTAVAIVGGVAVLVGVILLGLTNVRLRALLRDAARGSTPDSTTPQG